jgi:integrase/recombinase XerD
VSTSAKLSLIKQISRLDDALSTFLESLRPNTQRGYKSVLHEWKAFLQIRSLEFATADIVTAEKYLHAQARRDGQESRYEPGVEQKVSGATIARKATILHSIYQRLIAYEVLTHDPFVALARQYRAKTGEKRRTEALPLHLVPALLKAPGLGLPEGLRDSCILAVLLGAGLRRGELLNINIQHCRTSPDGTPYIILPKTKAGKLQTQPLPEWSAKILWKYLELRKKEGAIETSPVFITYHGLEELIPGPRMSESTLARLVKRYCCSIGLPKIYSPHSCRATAITKLLVDEVSYREVQEFSRHSSVQMVEVYDKRKFEIENHPGKKLDYE